MLWDKVILKKAMNKIPFYHFSSMKRYFPSVKSVDDFIAKKLSEIEVDVIGLEKDIKNLTPKDKLNVCLSLLTSISEEIFYEDFEFIYEVPDEQPKVEFN